MLDAPAITPQPSARHRTWLLLALLPIIAGTLWLASWPPWIDGASITKDGAYVVTNTRMTWNPEQWEVRRLDLRTGQTQRMPRLARTPPYLFSPDNRWLDTTHDGDRFESVSLVRVDDFSEAPGSDTSEWKSPPHFLDNDNVVVFDHDDDLRIVNLNDGTERGLPLPQTKGFRYAFSLAAPDRLIVGDVRNPRGNEPNWLVSLETPIKVLAEWNSNWRHSWSQHGESIYTLDADTDRLKELSVRDGSVVNEHSLDPLFEELPDAELGILLDQRKAVVVWSAANNRCYLYEFEQAAVVDCLPADVAGIDMSTDESFMVVGSMSGANSIGVFDLAVQAPRWRYTDDNRIVATRLTPDERHLIVVAKDGSVKLLDVSTGAVLRTYRSRAANAPVFTIVLVGFAAWCRLWVRAGVRAKAWPLFDAVFLNGLIAAAFIVRVNLSGSMQDPGRFAYQTAQSLFASWLVLLTCWGVFGRTRWTLRILAPLLGIAGTFAVVLINFRGDHYGVWQLVVGAVVVAAVCALWFGLLKRWGWMLSRAGSLPQTIVTERRGIPLRDLFLITAAVAALLAVVRFVSPHMFAAREVLELSIIVTTVSLTGVVATWAGLGPSHRCWRLLLVTLIVLAAGSVLPAAFANLRHWQNWMFTIKYQAFIALFACGTAWIFRAYGWRLRRALSDGCNNANQC